MPFQKNVCHCGFAVLDPAQAGPVHCLIQVFVLKKINLRLQHKKKKLSGVIPTKTSKTLLLIFNNKPLRYFAQRKHACNFYAVNSVNPKILANFLKLFKCNNFFCLSRSYFTK
jgi:hypothetical protein